MATNFQTPFRVFSLFLQKTCRSVGALSFCFCSTTRNFAPVANITLFWGENNLMDTQLDEIPKTSIFGVPY
jgi:hypothetical protein